METTTSEEKISFESIEEKLGFKIHPQIKDFFNTYYFRLLRARIMTDEGDVVISLSQILPNMNLAECLKGSIVLLSLLLILILKELMELD